jgi:type IV pilus biogenesis protein CpaD/CtpE
MAENGRIPGALTRRIVMVLLGALLASCSSSGGAGPATSTTSTPAPVAQASNKYPNAIVVLGHSGTTGYDSDPKAPATDAGRTPGPPATTRP